MDDRVKIIDHSRRHSYQILETMPTLEAHMGTGGGNTPLLLVAADLFNGTITNDVSKTLTSAATDSDHVPVVYHSIEISAGELRNVGNAIQTLRARMGTGGNNVPMVVAKDKHILRKITPTECARLQGFPDWWTDGAGGSDSAKYKMWGNGIALPCAADVIGRLVKELTKDGEQE